MRTLIILFVLIPTVLSSQAADRTADRAWISLFDGKSSQGWIEITGRPFPTSWTIDNGCLHAVPTAGGNQDLRTVAEFTDFDLHFDWRIAAGGNSGVKYLVQRVDEWERNGRQARARGPEYQLTDDSTSQEAARDRTRGTGSLYSVLAPTGSGVRDQEFHQSRIVKRQGEVEHWLDGKLVLRYRLDAPEVDRLMLSLQRGGAWREQSPIALQNHNSHVWFRNIRILPLR
jgi:hypothetical protein